jgi:hypothetical protein
MVRFTLIAFALGVYMSTPHASKTLYASPVKGVLYASSICVAILSAVAVHEIQSTPLQVMAALGGVVLGGFFLTLAESAPSRRSGTYQPGKPNRQIRITTYRPKPLK